MDLYSGEGRRRRRFRRRGGEISPGMMAVAAPVLGAHKALQELKPITSLVSIGKQFGIQKDLRNLMNKNKVGRFVNKAGDYMRNKLGFGESFGGARMVKVYLNRKRARRSRRGRRRRAIMV
jgi:hypothetical protein